MLKVGLRDEVGIVREIVDINTSDIYKSNNKVCFISYFKSKNGEMNA